MTALIYALQPDQVCLAMDTLTVSADDKTPLLFQTKFSVLPHLQMVIAGTGLAAMVAQWFQFVNGNMVVRDIDHVDFYAPDALRTAEAECPGTDLSTTTLYHFGYSREQQCYVGYAYRSAKNWVSENLPYALGVKPPVPVPSTDDIQFPQFLVDVMLEQRRADQSLPLSERVGIGGEVSFVVMRDQSVTVTPVHRFESYENEFQQMVAKLNA
jgi:hypothetical protein